jgi:hypothetical protein
MRKLLLLSLLATAAFAAEPGLAGGPFVVNVTSKSATIVWLVQSSELALQPAGDISGLLTSPSIHVEKTTMTGLKPNTKYEYKIPGFHDAAGSFKTPPTDDTPFDFVAYGDNRTRPSVHRQVIEQIVAHGIPDMVVQSGDLVADGSSTALWPIFFDIENELLRQTAFFPSLGNHEHHASNYFDFLQAKPYYSFDWGNAHFSMIDTDIGSYSPIESERQAYWAAQTHWLEEDLKAHQQAQYRFVAGHHPPFTAVASRQGDNAHITALTPMLEKYHVTAGFFGHDHNYQHYLLNGIHYVTSGGGGAPLYDVSKPPAGITQKVMSIENFVSVHVAGKTAHVRVIAIDGKVIDEFDLQGSAQPKPPVAPRKGAADPTDK